MRDHFSSSHPLIQAIYFVAVLIFSMLFMHPVFQLLALTAAAAYVLLLKGRRAVRFLLLGMVPLLLLAAVLNPAFNHAGVTILFYLRSGNPVTLESLLYGVAAACTFVTVIIWFSCLHVVMTSDKWVYLLGRILPALSLLLTMSLRFVPRYVEQAKRISAAQRCIGRDVTQGNWLVRARNGMTILSILTTWALENAMETADSMKARGYGLPGRTSFSLFRWGTRDSRLLLTLLLLLGIVGLGAAAGENTIRFFPSILYPDITWRSMTVYTAYGLLCSLPLLLNGWEEWRWRSTVSAS
ncbi:energy-coupling factor transporter transmembrane component T [Paenibacillus daejeonensis]|uniref:energy-coupling factor transporter transmembrane component T n=1 Tax=Paenibacillus daejeonensis TaxID=135193 RepID=UPI00037800A5|nr:energy-coupling factor transporter transmembrane component T [Paenibacillus daejeonensis]